MRETVVAGQRDEELRLRSPVRRDTQDTGTDLREQDPGFAPGHAGGRGTGSIDRHGRAAADVDAFEHRVGPERERSRIRGEHGIARLFGSRNRPRFELRQQSHVQPAVGEVHDARAVGRDRDALTKRVEPRPLRQREGKSRDRRGGRVLRPPQAGDRGRTDRDAERHERRALPERRTWRRCGSRRQRRRGGLGEKEACCRDVADPIAPVPLQRPFEQRPNRRRSLARQRRPVRIALEHGGQRFGHLLALEGAPSGEHLVEHAPERPDVAALVRRAALGLLRAHVGRRPEDDAHARQRRARDRR